MPTTEKPPVVVHTFTTLSLSDTKAYLESIVGREHSGWADIISKAESLAYEGHKVAISYTISGTEELVNQEDEVFEVLLKREFGLKDGDEILFVDVA